MQTRLSHQCLGEVDVVRRRNSSRFSACWRGGRVRVTGPFSASDGQFVKALDSLAPRLLRSRDALPDIPLGENDIVLDGLTIVVGRQSLHPRSVVLSPALPVAGVSVGCDIDLGTAAGRDLFLRSVRAVARKLAPQLLLPRAREIAVELGCEPSGWSISRGSTVLGKCFRSGHISLSEMCVFLPARLREYIVCHELAHLTYMDHSESFHRLLDTYLGGEERHLVNELKNYRWPIPR